ncbi:MAG: DUF692 family protein [Candidatus Omnitrophica bacterium]|nr:DUF692 family protein [Candidatus Omnitrophota bacterium]
MVELAVPISYLFGSSSLAKEVIAKGYCLECREESLESKEPKQYLFHFDKDIAHPWEREEKESISLSIQSKKELKLVSFHMAASCSRPVLKEGVFYCGGIRYSKEDMLNNARDNAEWLKDIIADRGIEIALENNNYYPTPAYEYVTDPDFISDIVYKNGIKFLFDLAHARITSHNRQIPYDRYLKGLPLERMIQIHISKHEIDGKDLAYDAHELPDGSILQEAKSIIQEFTPKYVTVEYYKDKEKLIEILEKLKTACTEPERQKI